MPAVDRLPGPRPSDEEPTRFVTRDAKLRLNMGTMFGREVPGFIRLNLAGPTPMLREACGRLESAVSRLG